VVTSAISGRPARAIRNRLTEELSSLDPLPFPAQQSVTKVLRSAGDPQLSGIYAGQSAALSREMTAGDLVKTLASETDKRLKDFG
jgi:nitronate monooxygenase